MDIEAFILIGGKSSRFGSDKASTTFGETSLLERTSATIEAAFPNARIKCVAANENQAAAKYATAKGLKVVCDMYENRGPLGAVAAALARAQTEWTFILACDYPFISAELLLRLVGFISEETDSIAPIQRDGMVQPLCSLYRVKPSLKLVRKMLDTDQSPPLKKMLERARTRFVTFNELCDLPNASNFFQNINTPDDLQTATGILDD